MRLPRLALTAVLALGLITLTAPLAAAAGQPAGRYIVVLEGSADAGAVADGHAERFGFDVSHVYRHALKGYAAAMTAGVAGQVAGLETVAWVERDRVVRAFAQTMPTGINRIDADLSPTAAINGVDQR